MLNETVELKRQLNDEREKYKRLNTQLQRLAVATNKSHSEVKNEALVLELEDKIAELSRTNLSLKSKLLQNQALKQQQSSSSSKWKRPLPIPIPRKAPTAAKPLVNRLDKDQENELHKQEVMRLQALVNMFRTKLIHTETALSNLEKENRGQKEEYDALLARTEMEKLSLEKQLSAVQKELKNDDDNNIPTTSLQQQIEQLSAALQKEQELRKRLERSSEQQKQHGNVELIIKDLKAQNEMLASENARLLELGANEQPKLHNLKIAKLESEIEAGLLREQNLHNHIKQLTSQLDAINPEYEQIKAKYNDLKEKAGFFERHGVANSSEIEEALALIRMRKDRGFNTTTDYMMEFDGQLEMSKKYEKERQRHVECIQDLEATKRLLKTQQQLNEKLLKDSRNLQSKFQSIRDEYELKLTEQQRLMEVGKTRISRLEGELERLAANLRLDKIDKAFHNSSAAADDDDAQLGPKQNLLEITVKSATLNNNNSNNDLLTFVSVEFYDYAPQMTLIAIGDCPKYNHIIRFPIDMTNDSLLQEYIRNTPVCLLVWNSLGGSEIQQLGKCQLLLSDLLTGDHLSHDYVCDVIGVDGYGRQGQLSVRVRLYKPFETDRQEELSISETIGVDFTNLYLQPSDTLKDLWTYNGVYLSFFYNGQFISDRLPLISSGGSNTDEKRIALNVSATIIHKTDSQSLLSVLVYLECDKEFSIPPLTSQAEKTQMIKFGTAVINLSDLFYNNINSTQTANVCDKSGRVLGRLEVDIYHPGHRHQGSSSGTSIMLEDCNITDDDKDSKPQINNSDDDKDSKPQINNSVEKSDSKPQINITVAHAEPKQVPVAINTDIVNNTAQQDSLLSDNNADYINEEKVNVDKDVLVQDKGNVAVEKEASIEELPVKDDLYVKEEEQDKEAAPVKGDASIKEEETLVSKDVYDDASIKEDLPASEDENVCEGKEQETETAHEEDSPVKQEEKDNNHNNNNDDDETEYQPVDQPVVNNDPPREAYEQSTIKITVDSVVFNCTQDDGLLSFIQESFSINQFFVSFQFLSYPAEELESESFMFAINSELAINFSTDFDFSSLELGSELTAFINSGSPCIPFTIVSEPSTMKQEEQCVDFAVGSVNLRQVAMTGNDANRTVECPLYLNKDDSLMRETMDGEDFLIPIGLLRVNIQNLAFLREVIELSQSPVKKPIPTVPLRTSSNSLRPSYSNRSLNKSQINSVPLATLPISSSFAKLHSSAPKLMSASSSSLVEHHSPIQQHFNNNNNNDDDDEQGSIPESVDELAEHLFDT